MWQLSPMSSSSPTATDLVFGAIAERGPLRFSEYMQLALYGDGAGFYRRFVPGHGSDYRTSPTMTPVFGQLIASAMERMYVALDEPDVMTVVEVGGGSGTLAESTLAALGPRTRRALRWHFIEPFGAIASLQRERLAEQHPNVAWSEKLHQVSGVIGCVIANEVLDNFPVDVYEVTEEGPQEVTVDVSAGRLIERLRPVSEPDAIVARAAAELEPQDRFEVSPLIPGWAKALSNALERGYALIFDYGDIEPQIWTRRPSGSIVTYDRGALGFDPFERPGDIDITSHVDFSSVMTHIESAGMSTVALTSQRDFLKELGLDRLTQDMRTLQQAAQEAGDHGEMLHLLAERGRAESLAARGGLGDLMVLIAAKDATAPQGFSLFRKPL